MIGCLLLIGSVLTMQVASPVGEDFNAEVTRLVRQLDAPQLARREAAEVELLGHGPAILGHLPPTADRLSAEVQQRLGRIRQKLEQAAADASTHASTITLCADAMPLGEILHTFGEQSGNTIIDYRREFGQPATDPTLRVHCEKTPFWPALDQLLDQAGLTLYTHGRGGGIRVIAALDKKKRALRVGRASYSGPFRFEPLDVVARRDPREPEVGSLVVTLEIAWEPRLRTINLMLPMADVRAVDVRGDSLPVADPAIQLEVPVGNQTWVVKLELPLQLPPRDVHKIASLKGKLLATIPGRIETFYFDRLANAKNVEKRIAGVTVALEEVHKAATGGRAMDGAWEVRVKIRFDDAGDALASHHQWIFSNPAYLIKKNPDGKPIAYDTFETTAQGKNEVGIAYLFRTERAIEDLTFVYQTPGTIVTSTFEYELKDIRLP